MIIAVDGPAASGKGTLARRMAAGLVQMPQVMPRVQRPLAK